MESTGMNQYLHAMAKQNMTAYASMPGSLIVFITGSVSCGLATPWSDLDTILLYDRLPSNDQLKRALKSNRGSEYRVIHQNEEGITDVYLVDGVECQFAHGLLKAYERRIREVQIDCSLNVQHHTMLSGMQFALPISGMDNFEAIQSQLSNYPRELSLCIIRAGLQVYPLDVIRRRIMKPDNTIQFWEVLTNIQKQSVNILCALNRMYLPGEYKKLSFWVERMSVKPPHVENRIRQIHSMGMQEALVATWELYCEILDLVETHIPEIELKPIRNRLNMTLAPITVPGQD